MVYRDHRSDISFTTSMNLQFYGQLTFYRSCTSLHAADSQQLYGKSSLSEHSRLCITDV